MTLPDYRVNESSVEFYFKDGKKEECPWDDIEIVFTTYDVDKDIQKYIKMEIEKKKFSGRADKFSPNIVIED